MEYVTCRKGARRLEQLVEGGGSEVRVVVKTDIEQGFSTLMLLTFWVG